MLRAGHIASANESGSKASPTAHESVLCRYVAARCRCSLVVRAVTAVDIAHHVEVVMINVDHFLGIFVS